MGEVIPDVASLIFLFSFILCGLCFLFLMHYVNLCVILSISQS